MKEKLTCIGSSENRHHLLENQNLREVDPEKLGVFIFYIHTPLGERIKIAEGSKDLGCPS
jgi:hypothetical protein